MKKMEDNSRQVLNLYEIHEIEKEEKNKKLRILPTILMIISIILIIGGLFYNNIIKLIVDGNTDNRQKKVNISDDNRLKCKYKKDDETLGINYTYSNSYKFENRLLKNSENVIIISSLTNSDIGSDNIKIISGKYLDIINVINSIEGIEASSLLKNNVLTVKYKVDYKVADLSKIPQNDKIIIDNKLDDSYASIKKKNQLSNYLC